MKIKKRKNDFDYYSFLNYVIWDSCIILGWMNLWGMLRMLLVLLETPFFIRKWTKHRLLLNEILCSPLHSTLSRWRLHQLSLNEIFLIDIKKRLLRHSSLFVFEISISIAIFFISNCDSIKLSEVANISKKYNFPYFFILF